MSVLCYVFGMYSVYEVHIHYAYGANVHAVQNTVKTYSVAISF